MQMEQYKDHAQQNAQNISTVCLQNTNKNISTIRLLQNTNKLEVAKIICTWKRNQVHTMFTNHFRRLVTLQTELYDWWELDDHRFQSKLVIFFRSCPRMAETMGTTSFKIFQTLNTSSIDVSWANKIL